MSTRPAADHFSLVAVDLIVDVSTAAREVAIGTNDPEFVRSLLADARRALEHLERIARPETTEGQHP